MDEVVEKEKKMEKEKIEEFDISLWIESQTVCGLRVKRKDMKREKKR